MMARKAQSLIATCVVIALFFFAVVVVECSSGSGKLRLRHRRDLAPAAQHASLLSASSSDGPSIIYEDGVVVETVLDENRLSMTIYSTLAVPFQDFLYAVDSTASQLLKIRLPIDQSSGSAVARRVAGDGKGRTGYNDGWGEDALLDHPKGLTIDADGNVYVADVRNRVIRKISPKGFVTTIAGQPNKTGHADGEGRNALLSEDFTLTYLPRTCSLLISDRGNGRLRMIQLKNPPLKCDDEGILSVHKWKNVTFLFGVLVTILVAALGLVLYQKAELQQSVIGYLAQEHEGGSPLNPHQNGGANYMPYLYTRPRLSDSAATLRRGRSLPDDISAQILLNRTDLMDFSDSPGEHNQLRNLLGNFDCEPLVVAENDDSLSMSSPRSKGDDETPTRGRPRIRPSEQDLGSDSESMSTGPNHDSSSRHRPNNSALVASDRRISIDDELNRNAHEFSLNRGNWGE